MTLSVYIGSSRQKARLLPTEKSSLREAHAPTQITSYELGNRCKYRSLNLTKKNLGTNRLPSQRVNSLGYEACQNFEGLNLVCISHLQSEDVCYLKKNFCATDLSLHVQYSLIGFSVRNKMLHQWFYGEGVE